MRAADQDIAIAVAGDQAILDGRGSAQLLDQEEADDQQQQGDGDADKTRGLPLGDLVARGFLKQRTMCIQATLLLQRGMGSA